MDIRDATENDIEAIADIYRAYVRTSIATLEEHEPSMDALRSEYSGVLSSGSPFIVGVERVTNKLCGSAYIGTFDDRSGYKFTAEDSIYLHPDYCGKGLGKQLLKALLAKIKATSTTTQVIAKMSIAPEQRVEDHPSCRLHMAFGFRHVGRLTKVGYKFGKWVDVVIWQVDVESVQT